MTIARTQENTSTKTARLEIRVTPSLKELIERAAAADGRSTTDFVCSAAQEVATRTLREYQQTSLMKRDREVFVAALLDAPAPSARLQAAAKRYKRAVSR
ncbi:DUF1778 domain-containing protein [Candidatus Acetothermia bacterium]|nr:DUF1778 domain-containing protein [Candidatus Acetothermia bacterium]MBI3459433.1 DUF1778 domain-containing protein [Candidatus Acetothermia bacterium]